SIDFGAALFGVPHSSDGFLVLVGTHRYFVAEVCSGLTYVTLGMFLGYCFGLLVYRSFHRVAALALLGALLGVFGNIVRVNAIVMIDWLRDSQMDLAAHGVLQWISVLGMVAILLLVVHR